MAILLLFSSDMNQIFIAAPNLLLSRLNACLSFAPLCFIFLPTILNRPAFLTFSHDYRSLRIISSLLVFLCSVGCSHGSLICYSPFFFLPSATISAVSWHQSCSLFAYMDLCSNSLSFVSLLPAGISLILLLSSFRFQCRGDGGWPRQAAGVLRDLVCLVSCGTLTWKGERRRLLRHCCWVGSSGGDKAQRWAGSSQAVCPSSDHSAGHSQHHLWEVRYIHAMNVKDFRWEALTNTHITQELCCKNHKVSAISGTPLE